MASIDHNKKLLPRPPIVAVMGHVDHGKTSLLDYIRRMAHEKRQASSGAEPRSVAEREAGGITQSIGSYEVEAKSADGKAGKITFIDTPGHEAFSKMRARGATVADLAILVVAADESVKPQTREAIKTLKDTNTSFIVAITKTDRTNSDVDRVKTDLMNEGILLEGFGGNISWQGVSVKTGEGVSELLGMIVLLAELENLTYNPAAAARGFVVESYKDNRRGIVANVIIKDGVLRHGDKVATPSSTGRVKFLENFMGKAVKELAPSAPAAIVGFETLPKAGEEFWVGEADEAALAQAAKVGKLYKAEKTDRMKVILKAETSGSLEALKQLIEPMVHIVEASVGEITVADVTQAVNTGSVIVAFGVKADKSAETIAQAKKIKISSSDVIYELIDQVKLYMKRETTFDPAGELEVLKVFDTKGAAQVIGGKILKGVLKKGADTEIWRDKERVGFGRLLNLQSKKKDVSEVNDGECGMLMEADVKVAVGDIIRGF